MNQITNTESLNLLEKLKTWEMGIAEKTYKNIAKNAAKKKKNAVNRA